jgi:hypothetical protein
MENRNGLVHDAQVTEASGHAECEAALAMLARVRSGRRVTLGGDKGYDVRQFVAGMRFLKVTPHVAQNTSGRSSAIGARDASARCSPSRRRSTAWCASAT